MPVYEYECTNCNYKFEKRQSINDQPIGVCPQCQGKVKRIISKSTGFIVKSSGSYKNDYSYTVQSTQNCCGVTNPCSEPKRCCENK
ncbi:MAG: zinc ribbon domain-containing protein [Candidatus Atribacteria bacterium]